MAAYPGRSITAINAGVSGSDVFYEYMLLKERLLAYEPDLVIVTINNTDLHDIMVRGDMDRFQSDGSTSFKESAPKWEWLYGISFILRHIMRDVLQYDDWFMNPKQAAQGRREARGQIIEAVDSFADLSQTNDFDLLIVAHPFEWELVGGRYRSEFRNLVVLLKEDRRIAFVDLLDYFRTSEIITSENAPQFFWSLDGHHNGKGYQAMGEAIAETLLERRFLDPARISFPRP
jgi:lysophospholipase L1-like esterase